MLSKFDNNLLIFAGLEVTFRPVDSSLDSVGNQLPQPLIKIAYFVVLIIPRTLHNTLHIRLQL